MSSLRYKDIKSYTSVLHMRKRYSLLVEGITDKKMICRLLNFHISNLNITIDSVDMIAKKGGMGNREIVEEVALKNPSRVVGWVDREFREFCLDKLVDHNPSHVRSGENIYWTRGHSIENYLFHVERFTTFLQMNHPEDSSQLIIQRVTLAFDSLLAWSLAFSISLSKASLMSKSTGIFDLDCWDILNAEKEVSIAINEVKIKEKLINREVGEAKASSVWESVKLAYSKCLSRPFLIRKWMVHGHIAEEALWAGIGKIYLENGASEDISKDIAYGFIDMKRKHGADWWVRETKPNVYPSEFIAHIAKICV